MINNAVPICYSRFVFLGFILALTVILFGAYTRLTNAGLSCPDWPRCYGYLTAPYTSDQIEKATQAYPQTPVVPAKAWTEMRHRYLAGLEGILIFTLVILSWYWHRALPPLVFKLSQSLIGVMLCQVLLGMLTVTALLKPVIVLGHLLLGFTVMSILWIMWLLTKKPTSLHFYKKSPWLTLGLIILILQITLGGWVSTHYAGLACIDLPYCNGKLLPDLHWGGIYSDLITIHMLHRLGAVITFIYLSGLSILFMLQQNARRFGILLALLLTTQVILGIFNILWLRPIYIALCHHAAAALLLLTLLAASVNDFRQGTRA